tara:strand:+ start:13199 stop:13375 length:177 start_codon:yes stop_codon:yes gene_type:complete
MVSVSSFPCQAKIKVLIRERAHVFSWLVMRPFLLIRHNGFSEKEKLIWLIAACARERE